MGVAARARAVSLFDPKRYAEGYFMHAKATVEIFTRSWPAMRRKGLKWIVPF